MAHTYILECSDGTYYVGSTIDLDRRLWEHNNDPAGPVDTRKCRPVRLAWAGEFDSFAEAFDYEKRIQGWGRKKREALIRGKFVALPALSRRKAVQERAARQDHPDS